VVFLSGVEKRHQLFWLNEGTMRRRTWQATATTTSSIQGDQVVLDGRLQNGGEHAQHLVGGVR
jgi:hypothetical protein